VIQLLLQVLHLSIGVVALAGNVVDSFLKPALRDLDVLRWGLLEFKSSFSADTSLWYCGNRR
jgi:hypothetical protein